MAETNMLSGGLEELNEVKTRLVELEAVRKELDEASSEKKSLEKQVEDVEKVIKDKVEDAIKKKRDEVSEGFDKILRKDNERLKEIRGKRDKALKKGKKERIEAETEDLHKENKVLKREIKEAFKQNGVPGFCNSTLFYGVMMPKGIQQYLIFVCVVLLFLILVPVGIWNLIPLQKNIWGTIARVAIVLFYIVLVGVSYFLLFAYTKDKHKQTLEEQRKPRKQVAKNNKKIRAITRKIKKDKNEKQYNLASFDKEIDEIQNRLQVTNDNKKKALDDFEKRIVPDITEEVSKNDRQRQEEFQTELQQTGCKQTELEKQYNELSAKIASQYTAYLGNEFMSIEKVDQLILCISQGQAQTIREGIELLKAQAQ